MLVVNINLQGNCKERRSLAIDSGFDIGTAGKYYIVFIAVALRMLMSA